MNKELDKALDICKSQIFLDKYAAFLGSLMCNVTLIWDESVPTAGTDGLTIRWNPDWFMSLEKDTRVTVLLHELWHIARLHIIRIGDRDPRIFNYACDIRINNDLENSGYSFEGVENCWKDQEYDDPEIKTEEEIYELLMENSTEPPSEGSWGVEGEDEGDMEGGGGASEGDGEGSEDGGVGSSTIQAQVINAVVQATQTAQITGGAGSVPGHIQQSLDDFLKPVIPWNHQLREFFKDLGEEDYTWTLPDRRYQDLYLPSLEPEEGKLEHLMYFLDVSGSVSDSDALRFASEIKYILETMKPKKMDVVQFDHQIQKVDHYVEGDKIKDFEIIGRGGTSLIPVRDMIIEHKPTCAVIFSDLYCAPMQELPKGLHTVWVVTGGSHVEPPFGKYIKLEE